MSISCNWALTRPTAAAVLARKLAEANPGRTFWLVGDSAYIGKYLLRGRPAKLNLIPFNVFPGTRYRRSPAAAILKFRDIINEHGVIATIRRTRGDDIDAACGQLAGRVTDRTLVRLGDRLTSASRTPAEVR